MELAAHGRFHHTGVAVADLEVGKATFCSLGFTQDGDDFEDHIQGIRGAFLRLADQRVEVVENLPGRTTVSQWLTLGPVAMYHLAYEVDDLDRAIADLSKSAFRLIGVPAPAVAFGGRPIAFLASRSRLLVEFIQGE